MSEKSKRTTQLKSEAAAPLLGTWSKGKLRKRLMLGHIIIFLVAIVMTIGGLAIQLGLDYIQEESDRMRALAEIMSDNIPAEPHQRLTAEVLKLREKWDNAGWPDKKGSEKEHDRDLEKLVESENFKTILAKFKTIKRSARNIEKVLSFAATEENLAIIICSDDPDDIGRSCYFTSVAGMAGGFKHSSSGDEPPLKTKKNPGMSGYAPIKTATGEKPAMVGISRKRETILDMIISLGWLWLLPIGAGLLLSFLMALRLAGVIMKPLQKTANVIKRLSEGDMSAYISPHDQQVTRVLRKSVMDLGSSLGKRERIHKYYGRTLSPALMEAVSRAGEEKLTRIERRDFSFVRVKINIGSISDSGENPEQYFEVINAASKLVIDAILDNGGSVEDINGVSVLGVFGSPIAMKDHIGAAVKAACYIRSDLADLLPRRRREDLPEFGLTIWVHTGPATGGIIGVDERGEYRVIGEPVRVINSLQRPDKTEGAGPVATEAIVKAGLPDGFASQPIGESASPAGTIKLHQINTSN